MTDSKPGRPPKPAAERADSHLHLRVKRDDKARWVRAAGGRKLSQWVIDALNRAADE